MTQSIIEKVHKDLINKAIISNFGRVSEFGIADFFYSSFVFTNLSESKRIFEFSMTGLLKGSVKEFLKQYVELTAAKVVFECHEYEYQNFTLADDNLNSFFHIASSEERHVVNFYCNTPEKFILIKTFLVTSLASKRRDDNVYAISRTPKGGLDLMSLGKLEYELEKENYESNIIEDYEYIIDQYSSKDPSGRLVILNGKPGVGKSHLVRGILSKLKNTLIIILPSRLTGEIDGPELIQLIISERKDRYGIFSNDGTLNKKKKESSFLFLIEDADSCLVPRGSDNMSTISSLLNYTDGIFGSMMDIRIIATTNAETINFDSALTRPGRLCSHVYLNLLNPERATSVFKRLAKGKEKIYKEAVSLAQVYQDVNEGKDRNAKNKNKQVVGFGI